MKFLLALCELIALLFQSLGTLGAILDAFRFSAIEFKLALSFHQ